MAERPSTASTENIINMVDDDDDDDINDLFNRVASKLGWLEEQMDLKDCSKTGTKQKKTRKCGRKKQSASKENTDPGDKSFKKPNVIKSSQKTKSRKKIKQNNSVSKADKCILTPSQDPILKNNFANLEHDDTNLAFKNIKDTFSFGEFSEPNDDNVSSKNSFIERGTTSSSTNYLLDQDLDELYSDTFSPLPNVRINRPKCESAQDCSTGRLATQLTYSCSISPLTVNSPVDGGPSPPTNASKSLNSSIEVIGNVKQSSEQLNKFIEISDCNNLENKKVPVYNLVDSESEFDEEEDFDALPNIKEFTEKDSEFSQTGELNSLRSNSPVENFPPDVKFTDSPEPMKWLLSPPSKIDRPIKSDVTNKVSDVESDCESNGIQSLKDRLKQKWKMNPAKDKLSGEDKPPNNINYRSSAIILDSSSDDDFESFLASIRTPSKTTSSNKNKIDDDEFINDNLSSSDDEKYYHVRLSQNDAVFAPTSKKKTNIKERRKEQAFKSFDDDDDDHQDDSVFKTPGSFSTTKPINKRVYPTNSSTSTYKTPISTVTPSLSSVKWRPNSTASSTSTYKTPISTATPSSSSVKWKPNSTASTFKTSVKKSSGTPSSFLKSLGTPYKGTSSPSPYVNNFKGTRDDLIKKLFTLYNDTVFENKLPSDFKITWNKRMRKTAGFCYSSRNRSTKQRFSRIELSDKVCDSAERLRDTLIHELCHAATWLIHGVSDGHGKFWKYWAAKANVAHPEIPIISRCHSYVINTKYKYECSKCGYTIGRHSKSLDTSKYRCGCCRGELVLKPQLDKSGNPVKKRAPSKFALYVKENYSVVKKDNDKMKHADVMRLLSQEFGNKAKLTDS